MAIEDDAPIIPFFEQPYKVSSSGIVDSSGKEPLHSLKVVFCQYLTAAENSQQSYLTGIIVIQAGIIEVFGLCAALESLDRQPL